MIILCNHCNLSQIPHAQSSAFGEELWKSSLHIAIIRASKKGYQTLAYRPFRDFHGFVYLIDAEMQSSVLNCHFHSESNYWVHGVHYPRSAVERRKKSQGAKRPSKR